MWRMANLTGIGPVSRVDAVCALLDVTVNSTPTNSTFVRRMATSSLTSRPRIEKFR